MKKSKMLFIVAAGNDGELIDDSNVVYPAMYDLENMITVGSARQNGNIADFSNYSNEFVDVLAPGERILSQNQDNEWEYYDGTTYSTAYVSAMAIRTMINEGIETAKDIKTSVIKKANDRNKLKKYVKYGGLINKSENR